MFILHLLRRSQLYRHIFFMVTIFIYLKKCCARCLRVVPTALNIFRNGVMLPSQLQNFQKIKQLDCQVYSNTFELVITMQIGLLLC
jgi:hypothetical protein